MIRGYRERGSGVLVFYLLLQVVCVALSLAEIVTGTAHLHDCHVQPLMAVYLIVGGVVPLLVTARGCCGNSEHFSVLDACTFVIFLFQIAWTVCGSVWIYPTFEKVIHSHGTICLEGSSSKCVQIDCDRNFAIMACVFVTLDWVTLMFLIIVMTCVIFM